MSNRRLVYLDTARGLAVFLSLLAHVLLVTDGFQAIGEQGLLIQQFTRLATPLFVFLFGFVIEFNYVNQIRNGKREYRHIIHRCLIRSAQCYLAFVFISAASVLGGYRTIYQFLASITFLTHGRFGNIFRVYSILLLVVPVFVWLRLNCRRQLVWAMLTLLFASCIWTSRTGSWNFGILGIPMNIWFGVGDRVGGPSILHSLLFFLSGMYIATGSRRACAGRGNPQHVFGGTAVRLFLLTIAVLVIFRQASFFELWHCYANGDFRSHNRIEYFLIGTATSVLIFQLMHSTFCSWPVVHNLFAPLGQRSMMSYLSGNVILNLFGNHCGAAPDAVVVIAFLAGVWLLAKLNIDWRFTRRIKGHLVPGTQRGILVNGSP